MEGRFTPDAQQAGQTAYSLLNALIDRSTRPPEYGDAMMELGRLLGEALARRYDLNGQHLCIAFTVEDADYLARGVIEAVQSVGAQVFLACFWNRRDKLFDIDWLDVAPIVQEYIEPLPKRIDHLLLLKSIISGACVVRTNLMRLLDDVRPEHIHVIAPVMLHGAENRLSQHMPAQLTERFEYLTFAVDTEKSDDGDVLPGIGGQIYDRLGMHDAFEKNMVMPRLVEERLEAGG